MIEDPLEILLIEDNPGDARLVREMVEATAPLEGRFDREVVLEEELAGVYPSEEATSESAVTTLTHVESIDAGIDAVNDGDVDIVLLDLNLPESRGIETLDALLDAVPPVPIVVLTGIQDRTLGLEALDHGAHDYLVKDEINADLLIRTIYHALQRAEYERLLQRQHDRLSTLYEISVTAQDIAGSLIDCSTRTEIESTLCRGLAGAEEYRYAWIGAFDQGSGPLSPRVGEVPDTFFDDVTITLGDREADGPVGRAARTQETHVLVDVPTDAPDELRDHATEFDYRAVAAIPISYEGAMYGVLAVHTDRPSAFEDEEVQILTQLGAVIGYAIAAIERKAALMNESAVQLDLLVPDFIQDGTGDAGEIEFLTTLPAGDGEYLQYARVGADVDSDLEDRLGQIPEFADTRLVEERADGNLIEIAYDGPPLVSTLASYGGQVRTASLADGDFHVTVDLPADADVRSFVESIQDTTQAIELVAQRSVESTPTVGRSGDRAGDGSLTDKQRQAIEAAYFAGYFEQPRQSTGEEIAESLEITASTFHQHLQAGLRNMLSAKFDDADRPTELRRGD